MPLRAPILTLVSASVAITACASTPPPPPSDAHASTPAPAIAVDAQPVESAAQIAAACKDPNDIDACYRGRRTTCTRSTRAWRLRYEGLPELTVSESSMLRARNADRTLYGTDSKHWIGCLADCASCIPYEMPISFSLKWAPDCKVRDHDAPAWRGQAARAIDVTCKDGVTTATYVPALLPVRDALLASGAIAKNDRLAKIEGLLVDARTEEGDPVITLADIAVASCDDLALPADRPRVTTLYAFRALPARIAEVKPAFDKKVSAVTEEMKGNIESQMREDLGRKCFGRPDGFSKEELVACVKSRPELHAKATMLATGLRVARAFVPTLEGIIRTDYDAPLCKLYAPESGAK